VAKAVFLDRDGTIIEDRGYLRDPGEVVFLPGAFESLRRLGEEFRLFIVTNQSGVARKEITPRDVDIVNAHVVAELAAAGVEIVEAYVCPHCREDGCSCIKPHPHFLHEAARRYGVDLARSFTVGDHPHDVEFGHAAGGLGIYVLTGHGVRHRPELSAGLAVAADIRQATDWMLTISAWQGECDRADESRRGNTPNVRTRKEQP
jgi:D-glycero-D-manno-heptose 1,7-bisphosphate phosphatase